MVEGALLGVVESRIDRLKCWVAVSSLVIQFRSWSGILMVLI